MHALATLLMAGEEDHSGQGHWRARDVHAQKQKDAQRDKALAAQLAHADELIAHAALGGIVKAYFNRLARFTYTIVQSRDEAEDIVQGVFVRVWEKRRDIDPDKSLPAYLFTSVRRAALDLLKHQIVETKHADIILQSAEPVTLSVDERLDAENVERAVRATVAQLAERRRTVIRLRYEEGLPFADVAEVMGISEKAAKDLTARAVLEIRKRLGL